MLNHIYIQYRFICTCTRTDTRVHTHTHVAWNRACDYDKPCCLSRSSPRLWKRMGRNAKESRRSQAYSSTVGVTEGGGLKWTGRGLDALSFLPSPRILSVCRDPMCVNRAVEHPLCLFYLFLLFPQLPLPLILISSLACVLSLLIILFLFVMVPVGAKRQQRAFKCKVEALTGSD